ncbi:YopX family protein, partial [Enterococcus faecalis]|nr:YopX family protein [Enterococcus faecalis]
MIPKFRAWDTYEKEMLENVTPLFDDSNSMIAIITEF